MLETNANKTFREKKSYVDLKTVTKGDDIREEIEDNAIMIIYVQSKALEGHTEKLKKKLNYALKEANDERLAKKE